jgi:hypothetical protein
MSQNASLHSATLTGIMVLPNPRCMPIAPASKGTGAERH